MNYKLYIDLDGVLVDFCKGYKEITGETLTRYVEFDSKIWDLMNQQEGWWRDLSWMEDGQELWDYVKKYEPAILSAAPKECPSAYSEKIEWCRTNISDWSELIICKRENKKNYVSPTSILIDDYEKNINDWRNAGGIAIMHTSTENTIAALKLLGI